MKWLLLLWMATATTALNSDSIGDNLVCTILNEEDYIHCDFLVMMDYARPMDENTIRVRLEHLNETKEYLKDFKIPYEMNGQQHGGGGGGGAGDGVAKKQTRVEQVPHGYRHRRDVVIHAIPTKPCLLDNCPEPKINDWMSYEEITDFVTTINTTFPERVLTTSLGETAEGRQIWQVRIQRGPCDEDKNFYLMAGSEAREWIGPAVAVNFIWRLIYECLLAPGYSFYIVPLLNPDGYEFSRNNDTSWVKNRANTSNENCTGVNVNLNYSFKFGEAGSSLDECSDVYNGGSPFSEVESQALQTGCTLCTNITMLMHLSAAYKTDGESISYPWSYTSTAPDHEERLLNYAKVFQEAAYYVHGTNYTVKQDSSSSSAHAGTVIDWATGVQEAGVAYRLRLRGNGTYSLDDATIIMESVEEAWVGFDAMVRNMIANEE